jgi:hypothetical protein
MRDVALLILGALAGAFASRLFVVADRRRDRRAKREALVQQLAAQTRVVPVGTEAVDSMWTTACSLALLVPAELVPDLFAYVVGLTGDERPYRTHDRTQAPDLRWRRHIGTLMALQDVSLVDRVRLKLNIRMERLMSPMLAASVTDLAKAQSAYDSAIQRGRGQRTAGLIAARSALRAVRHDRNERRRAGRQVQHRVIRGEARREIVVLPLRVVWAGQDEGDLAKW